jgi:hypothetical protein
LALTIAAGGSKPGRIPTIASEIRHVAIRVTVPIARIHQWG